MDIYETAIQVKKNLIETLYTFLQLYSSLSASRLAIIHR